MPVLALLIAFAIGAALIRMQGVNPWYAYETLLRSALGTERGLLRTLQKATPLVLAGLAVAVALRVGLFNIGAQGQLLWGAIAAAYVGTTLTGLPAALLIPSCMLAGMLAGALWGAIAGVLKATRGVHEVISTIMLNSIAVGIIDYLVSYPLKQQGQPIPRTAWVLQRTTLGFRFDTVGKNRHAACYAGIRIPYVISGAMFASGALAGLGGAVETLGVVHRYEAGSSSGLGFDGITIALLARSNPWATIPAALLVGALPILAGLVFGQRAKSGVALTSGWGS